jgi:hypothetical protein
MWRSLKAERGQPAARSDQRSVAGRKRSAVSGWRLAAGCLLLAVAPAWAAGDIGFASLKIGIGSRECGMGDAGTAAARGPQAIYWNPALNGWAEGFAANVSYSAWFVGMSKGGLFVVRPTPVLNLGLGLTSFSAGKLENRDDRPTDEPIGTFEPADYSLYLNLSRPLAPKVAMGFTGRCYYQKILDHSVSGVGADFGLLFLPRDGMKVGLAVLDFGSSMKYKYADFALPTRGNAGVSYSLPFGKSEFTATGDFGYGFFDQRISANLGAEVLLNQVLALRAGYKTLDPTAGLTMGLGVRVKGVRLEYSFGLHDLNLGATHRFALGLGY